YKDGRFGVAAPWAGHGGSFPDLRGSLRVGKRVLQRRKARTRRQEVARSQEKPGVRATPIMETSLSGAPNIVCPRVRIVKSVVISSIRRRGRSDAYNPYQAWTRGSAAEGRAISGGAHHDEPDCPSARSSRGHGGPLRRRRPGGVLHRRPPADRRPV